MQFERLAGLVKDRREAMQVCHGPAVQGPGGVQRCRGQAFHSGGAAVDRKLVGRFEESDGRPGVAERQFLLKLARLPGALRCVTKALQLAAAQAAGLVGALSGHTQLTVFAPTDAAFAKLPKGTVENLLKPENKDQLVALLSYHVVPGAVRAADIPHGVTQVGTIKQGGDTKVVTTRFGDRVTVDFARVVQADIHASNGVIHVINRVLMPTN